MNWGLVQWVFAPFFDVCAGYQKEILIGLVGAVTVGLLGTLATWAIRAVRHQHVHSFWRPFARGSVSIITSEYPNEATPSDDPVVSLARNLGIHYFISRGNANALAILMHFLSKEMRHKKVRSYGDKTLKDDAFDNLVIVGSPATNQYSRAVFRTLMESFDIGYDIIYDDDMVSIVDTNRKNHYAPKIDMNHGVDYALVIRAHVSGAPNRWCVLLCGASMWGVEGAAQVVTSPSKMRKLSGVLGSRENFAFLVKVDVINNSPHNPEILRIGTGTRRYVRVLRRRSLQ